MSSEGPPLPAGLRGLQGLHTVRVQLRADGVVRVTLDRQDAANSRNQQMRDELRRVYDVVADDDRASVLVLTGAGERFFCAGMDLKEAGGKETPLGRRDRLRRNRDIEVLASLPLPTIAAVNGYALGGGLEMALACDIRVFAEHAQAGLPEVTHGLVPGGGGTQRLPRLIGSARTLELIYTGRRVAGPEAAALGLATMCVPGDQLASVVDQLTGDIAAKPRAALRMAKELVLSSYVTPLSVGVDLELAALLTLLDERSRTVEEQS